MRRVAVSACLLGCSCRYDGRDNLNNTLLEQLKSYEIISFCPEDFCFSTPRPTMDLIKRANDVVAVSNETNRDLSEPILQYAYDFFNQYSEIELFIGKDRSPSCGVKSAKVYDAQKNLISTNGTGLMAKVALELGIVCWDSEVYMATHNHTS